MSETLKISEQNPTAESLINDHISRLSAEKEAADEKAFVESVVGNDINDEKRITEATDYMRHLESIQGRTEIPQPINEQIVDNIEQQFDYEPVQEINELIKMMDECRESKDTLGNRKKMFSLETKFQEAFDKCEAQGFDHDFLEAMLDRVYPPKNIIENSEPAIKDDETAVLELKTPELVNELPVDSVQAEEIVEPEVQANEVPEVPVSNDYKPTQPQIDALKNSLSGVSNSRPPISLENNPLYQPIDEKNNANYSASDAQKVLLREMMNKNPSETETAQENGLVKKATERANSLMTKTKKIFGAVKEDVVETIMPVQWKYESDAEYQKRLNRAAVLKSIGFAAIATAAILGGQEIVKMFSQQETVANAAALPVTPESIATNIAYNVNPGDGWYDTFKQLGVPKSEWANVLNKVGDQLVSSGWAYSNGESYGIAHTGQLPDEVVKLIQSSI